MTPAQKRETTRRAAIAATTAMRAAYIAYGLNDYTAAELAAKTVRGSLNEVASAIQK